MRVYIGVLHVQGTAYVVTSTLELSGTISDGRRLLSTDFKSSLELAIATQCARPFLSLICSNNFVSDCKIQILLDCSSKYNFEYVYCCMQRIVLLHAVILPNLTSKYVYTCRSKVPLTYVNATVNSNALVSGRIGVPSILVTSNVIFTDPLSASTFLNTVNTNPSAILFASTDIRVQVSDQDLLQKIKSLL